ncbi:DUF4936 family protein [Massilia sp. H-1]|nr:DUF4936 family protein [Massilia sp. H-1]
MSDLYIYYRVPDEHAQQLAPRVQGHAGRARWWTAQASRPGSRDGMQTWMEIYPDAPDGFDAALALAVRQAALSELISGERHTEVFTDLSTCA